MKLCTKSLLWPAIIMSLLSSFIVYSVSPERLLYQAGYFLLGIAVYFAAANIGWRKLLLFAPYIYILTLLLLVLTYFFGHAVRGSNRWLSFGAINLQASELAKLSLILFLPYIMAKSPLKALNFVLAFAVFLLLFAAVFIQPDLGSALLLLLIFGIIFLISKIPVKIKLLFVVLALVLVPLLYPHLKGYQRQRIVNFLNPYEDPAGSGYNVIQSVLAVGSGQFFGKGLGLGSQSQLHFLPERQTDFVFASFVEEMGFLGGLAVMAVYFYILWRLISIVQEQDNIFSQMIAVSIFFVFFVQVAVNIGMNMGILPVTGLPLPLLSVGGNSILVTMFLFGLADSLFLNKEKRACFYIG